MRRQQLPTAESQRLPEPSVQRPPHARRLPPTGRTGRPARTTQTPVTATVEMWVADGEAQGHSGKTCRDRRAHLARFVWWLEHEAGASPILEALTADLIRKFFTYLREPSTEGRFGTGCPCAKRAARPATVHRYFRELRTFSNFCVEEGLLRESPLASVKSPLLPVDQIQPFSPLQVKDLVAAASRTLSPDRNRAMLLLLLDTGLRSSEACSLTIDDLQQRCGEISVQGKGGKRRTVYLGTVARRAFRLYLARERSDAEPGDPLFLALGGIHPGSGITPSGAYQIVLECGRLARVDGVRCSPHTFRHTFAVQFLRGGGNLLELQRLMGHTDLTVLRRYVQLAESDLARAHRRASPADQLGMK